VDQFGCFRKVRRDFAPFGTIREYWVEGTG
jgi:hypothetical protein